MRKLALVAALAMATAVAIPSTASAIWTHTNHAHLLNGSNPQAHGEGTVSVTNGSYGVSCASGVTATVQLTGGTTTGHVNQFTADKTKCGPTGANAACTLDGIDTEALPYVLHIANGDGQPTGVKVQITQSGLFCVDYTLSGNGVTIEPIENGVVGKHTTIQAVKLSGQLSNSVGGSMTVSGQITATAPSLNTFGYT